METLPFWVGAMTIKGSQRIGDLALERLPIAHRWFPNSFYRTSPGWCEISYLNTCESDALSERDLLLAIAFALIQRQYGFAADLARRGGRRFGGPLFDVVGATVRRRLRLGYFRLGSSIARGVLRRLT